jgi:hypothetical protein
MRASISGSVSQGEDLALVAFGWDGQHSGDELCVFGMAERGPAEQGVDSG